VNWKRAAAVAAGVTAGTAAGILATRAAIRRERRRVDPEEGERLAQLPPDDVGPVRSDDGTPLDVRAAGNPSRPAVVFSHGFSLDMTTWHYQWTQWSERYRCVLFDHRGHGRSGTPANRDYTLQAMGEDIRAVLDAIVGSGPCVLVGHSMGGMAVLAFAEAHPEEFGSRVAGVILADTAAAEILRGAIGGILGRLQRLRLGPERAERVRRFLRSGRSDLSYLVARLTNFGQHASPWLVDYVSAISGRAPVEVWTDGLAGIMELDVRHALEHVKVPALVVVGDVDRLTPPASARALADALPDARLVVLEGAGHLAMMERHVQFNRVAGRFLDEVLGAASERADRPARGRRRARAGGPAA
jgi:pimeloyl-ACP methyl ester carboxylesterase